MKMRIKVFKFLKFSIQSIIQMKNSFSAPVFAWQHGCISGTMGIPCIKYVLEELWKTKFSKLTADTSS